MLEQILRNPGVDEARDGSVPDEDGDEVGESVRAGEDPFDGVSFGFGVSR